MIVPRRLEASARGKGEVVLGRSVMQDLFAAAYGHLRPAGFSAERVALDPVWGARWIVRRAYSDSDLGSRPRQSVIRPSITVAAPDSSSSASPITQAYQV